MDRIHPSLLILLVGLLYLLGFGALSFMRRQGLSARFAIEGLIITAAINLSSFVLAGVLNWILVILRVGAG